MPIEWHLSGAAQDVRWMSECRCMNVCGNILTLGKMRSGCSFWKTGKATEWPVSCDMHYISLRYAPYRHAIWCISHPEMVLFRAR